MIRPPDRSNKQQDEYQDEIGFAGGKKVKRIVRKTSGNKFRW